MNIAIIGSNGFFGSQLKVASNKIDSAKFHFVTRDNYKQFVSENNNDINIAINSAMPSARFWAENEPAKDFIETVSKTRRIIDDFPNAKIVQISSISASTQLHKVYGRHKKAAEALLKNDSDLIFRLGPLYGSKLKKGVIIDLINDKNVYISEQSKYAFTNITWAAEKIINNLDLTGIIEFGAQGYMKIDDLKEKLNSKSECLGEIDHQVFTKYFDDTPDSSDVINFALEIKNNNQFN